MDVSANANSQADKQNQQAASKRASKEDEWASVAKPSKNKQSKSKRAGMRGEWTSKHDKKQASGQEDKQGEVHANSGANKWKREVLPQ